MERPDVAIDQLLQNMRSKVVEGRPPPNQVLLFLQQNQFLNRMIRYQPISIFVILPICLLSVSSNTRLETLCINCSGPSNCQHLFPNERSAIGHPVYQLLSKYIRYDCIFLLSKHWTRYLYVSSSNCNIPPSSLFHLPLSVSLYTNRVGNYSIFIYLHLVLLGILLLCG